MNTSSRSRSASAAPLALALATALGGFGGCVLGGDAGDPERVGTRAQAIAYHDVYVSATGEFSPRWLHVRDGDVVTWHLYDRRDAIVPRVWPSLSTWPAICTGAPSAYDPSDPNEFTGPMPVGAAGVHVMGTIDGATAPAIWQSARINAVFVKLSWDAVDGGPDWAARYAAGDWPVDQRYDWTALDGEMNQAVANGKMFSVGVRAGRWGTPDWIFDTNPDGSPRGAPNGGVTRLTLTDDRTTTPTSCGDTVQLGNPAQASYQAAYNAMLTALGDHIRANNAWYRALAYVKLSGANRDTHENMLPSGCASLPGCICNPEVWSDPAVGYTPEGLYAFYLSQAQAIARAFPGKSMSYMLIHDGFPLVNAEGDYLGPSGPVDRDGDGLAVLPDATTQTWEVIQRLQNAHRTQLAVQHNGLMMGPAADYAPTHYAPYTVGRCRYHGLHPVGAPPYDHAGVGCPNPWVLRAGWRTRSLAGDPWVTLTGFQIMDDSNGPANPPDLERAFQNAWDSSDAVFVEIYQARFHEAEAAGGVLDPGASGFTIGDWNDLYAQRRRDWITPNLPDPAPLTFSHTFRRTRASGGQLHYYIHGSKCGVDDPAVPGVPYQYGVVVVDP